MCPSVQSTHGRRNAARCLCLLRIEVFGCCWFVCVKELISAMEANTWSPGHSSSVGGFREWVRLVWFSFFHGPQICSTLDVEDICPPGKNNLNSLGHFSPFSFASVHTNRMSSLNRKEILKPPSSLIRRERHRLGKGKHFLSSLFLHPWVCTYVQGLTAV